MPAVCQICGSSNRSNAKFCVGCARPLPGFSPSGPGALDAMMAVRPNAEGPERAAVAMKNGRPVPVLPAETAAFWLKAGCVGLLMLLAFAVWCFQVTRKPGAPPLRAELMSMLAPATGPVEAAPQTMLAPATGSVEAAPTAAVPASAAPAAAPAPALPPAASNQREALSLPAPRSDADSSIERTPLYDAAPRAAGRAGSRPYGSRRERTAAYAPAAATEPAPERATTPPDSGPPIAISPGPDFTYPRRAIRAAGGDAALTSGRAPSDPGPPLAPGPGPQYDYSRMPAVRAPSWSSNDLGPPIAIGPGPSSPNYAPRGAGVR